MKNICPYLSGPVNSHSAYQGTGKPEMYYEKCIEAKCIAWEKTEEETAWANAKGVCKLCK